MTPEDVKDAGEHIKIRQMADWGLVAVYVKLIANDELNSWMPNGPLCVILKEPLN